MLPGKIAPTLAIHPRHVDRAFALDQSDRRRYRVLRRDRHQHVHMIRQQMPFLNRALLPPGQLMKHFAQVPS